MTTLEGRGRGSDDDLPQEHPHSSPSLDVAQRVPSERLPAWRAPRLLPAVVQGVDQRVATFRAVCASIEMYLECSCDHCLSQGARFLSELAEELTCDRRDLSDANVLRRHRQARRTKAAS